ncbi:MAG TPA: hypothetical protein VJ547_01010 [Candidatus Thermoplasmatota archaeon]|nr:hypothetical protein [Candidatus Thermoplasmatota archaeon]
MERRGRGRRSKDVEAIAAERIEILFEEARRAALQGKPDRARRYVLMARKTGMRYNVPIPGVHRRWVCRACGAYLVPGANASVRLRPRRIVVRCLECKAIKRIGRSGAGGTPGGRGA